jgi:hypothetical protein
MKTLQKFASVHANIHDLFALERHLTDRETFKGGSLRARPVPSKAEPHRVESGLH